MKKPQFTPINPAAGVVVGTDLADIDAPRTDWFCGACQRPFANETAFRAHLARNTLDAFAARFVTACDVMTERAAMAAVDMVWVSVTSLAITQYGMGKERVLRYLGAVGALVVGKTGLFVWRQLEPYFRAQVGDPQPHVLTRAALLIENQEFAEAHDLLLPVFEESGGRLSMLMEALDTRVGGLVEQSQKQAAIGVLEGGYSDGDPETTALLAKDSVGAAALRQVRYKMTMTERKK